MLGLWRPLNGWKHISSGNNFSAIFRTKGYYLELYFTMKLFQTLMTNFRNSLHFQSSPPYFQLFSSFSEVREWLLLTVQRHIAFSVYYLMSVWEGEILSFHISEQHFSQHRFCDNYYSYNCYAYTSFIVLFQFFPLFHIFYLPFICIASYQ